MVTRKQTKGEKLYEKLYALHDQSLSDGGEAEAAKRAPANSKSTLNACTICSRSS